MTLQLLGEPDPSRIPEWGGREHPVQPPAQARSPGAGDTGRHPGGVGMSFNIKRETPHPPWAVLPMLCYPQHKEIFPYIEMDLPVLISGLAPCPIVAVEAGQE